MIEKPQTISVLHTLPGRIRLHLSNWPGQRARHLEKLLRQIPGVCRAKANPLTHNVLIGFDAQRLSQKTLLGHLQSMLPLPLEDTAASAGSTNHPVEDDSLPPVIEEWVSGPRQRARIAVRGLDRDPRFAKHLIQELEKYPQVRAEAVPLTGHVLVEYESDVTPLDELVARVAELELSPLPHEERPAHPLDPAPLAQALIRTAGATLGLVYIAVQRLRHVEGESPQAAAKAATVSAVIGLLRSFPFFRHGLRKACGPNTADAALSVASIISLTITRSPLGLVVMGIEAYILLRQILAQRKAWQRYEHHHGTAPEIRPNSVVRLEAGDRLPMRGRVLQGTGTAIHRDGLPVPIRPGLVIPAGSQLAGGPFILQLKEGKPFVPSPPQTPTVPKIFNTYLNSLGPVTLLYAGMTAAVTRSLAQTFNALLLVNPRTALGGTEAANLDASTRVIHCGVIVAGSRPDRVIQRPHLVLLDGARIVTDGLELCHAIPLHDERDSSEWLALAAGVAVAAGSPWGKGLAHVAHEAASEGAFDGTTATAAIGSRHYTLQPVKNSIHFPQVARFRNRGEYVLQLSDTQTRQPLALIVLRPKLAAGAHELVQTCKRHGVQLGIVPGGNMVALQAIVQRVEIPLVVSANAAGTIRKAHRRKACVAFVSDSADAAEAFADCDLAIGIAASRQSFPARVDLLAPNLTAVAAIIEAGARRDTAVRDAVLLSAASNMGGAVWGFFTRPGIERVSIPVYLGLLSAVVDGLARMAGGKQSGAALAYLIDPHPERWGLQSIEDVLQALQTSEQGLTSKQAVARRRHTLSKSAPRQETLAAIFEQFSHPITSILAGAASLSLIVGQPFDFAIIAATIGINIAIGVWQERRTHQAAEALKQIGTATARVLRDGKIQALPAPQLVTGDVLLLKAGDRVAADARLISAENLEVDEAALTGESFPVIKTAHNGPADNRVVLEGSDVVVGTGRAVIVAVGNQTRLGTMAAAMEVDEIEQSPLGKRLERLLWQSLPITTAASVLVVISGIVRKQPLIPQLMVGASMALAAIPEGLPLLASMGQGGVARRLAQRKALVRRLAAVEALGRVDVACVDKTGTLTVGRLSLSLVADGETQARLPGNLPPPLSYILLTAAYASPHPEAVGATAHPTDVAVMQGAEAAGLGAKLHQQRSHEDPFDPAQGFHATAIQGRLCVKGAPEILLPRCNRQRLRDGENQPLDNAGREAWMNRARQYAEQSLRVLMVAEGTSDEAPDDPKALVALGLLGIHDPLRPGIKAAVKRCHNAGVRVVMITGDHPATARSVAEEAGLPTEEHALLTGSELTELNDDELDQRMAQATVIARATPLDKLRIIESLQRRGHTVAMTGDGVNDAPALRLAEVGVAMGRAGTEVARQAADLVLADDDFATLVEALVEGRVFWQNMRRALGLLLGGNLGELGLIASTSILGYPNPLNAPQILIVNLITDALPALAIVLQHPEHRDLSELAREGVTAIDGALINDIMRRAILTAGPSLVGYILSTRAGDFAQANTIAFASIIGNQLAQTYEAGHLENQLSPPVLKAMLGSLGILGVVLIIPPLRNLLQLALPTPLSWALISASALSTGGLSRLTTSSKSNDAPEK